MVAAEAVFGEHPLPGGLELRSCEGPLIAAVAPNDWETRFFGRPIGALRVVWNEADRLDPAQWQQAVARLVAAADGLGYQLVQGHLDVRGLGLAPALEDAGFRLVDTRITFSSCVDRRQAPRFEPAVGSVRIATAADLPALLGLTHQGLTDNPAFHSRYKDRAYFAPEETRRWFAAWVENDLTDPDNLVALWEVEGEPAGFFGYARRGERDGLPVYKGTLAAVAPAWQGKQGHLLMQTVLHDHLPTDEFWAESTTQLGNTPIFRNHLVTGKRLDRIELTYFRAPPG